MRPVPFDCKSKEGNEGPETSADEGCAAQEPKGKLSVTNCAVIAMDDQGCKDTCEVQSADSR